jgi:dTDP-glucose pyrophosphorylase
MQVLVLLAGSSEAFSDKGYTYPKYLVEINGKPLIEYVINTIKDLCNAKFIFAVLKEDCEKFHLDSVIDLLIPSAKIVQIEQVARGAACTALLAIEYIHNDEPLLIINGDQIVDVDIFKAIQQFQAENLDGGIITFDSVHPRWSYVRLNDENLVIEASEKRPISKYATAGTYYFRKGSDFIKATMSMIEKDANVNGLYYVCPSYNEMILNQAKIGTYHIEREKYISVATPEGIENFKKYLESNEVAYQQ